MEAYTSKIIKVPIRGAKAHSSKFETVGYIHYEFKIADSDGTLLEQKEIKRTFKN